MAAATAVALSAYVTASGPDALGAKAGKAAAALSVDGWTTLGCSGAFIIIIIFCLYCVRGGLEIALKVQLTNPLDDTKKGAWAWRAEKAVADSYASRVVDTSEAIWRPKNSPSSFFSRRASPRSARSRPTHPRPCVRRAPLSQA